MVIDIVSIVESSGQFKPYSLVLLYVGNMTIASFVPPLFRFRLTFVLNAICQFVLRVINVTRFTILGKKV